MPVFSPISSTQIGSRGITNSNEAPLAGLIRQYPQLAQYAGQLGLTTDPNSLYGYTNAPPMLYPNQPGMGISTLQNTPPILEGIDPSAAESVTGQFVSGNPNLGSSVGLEQSRGRGQQVGPQAVGRAPLTRPPVEAGRVAMPQPAPAPKAPPVAPPGQIAPHGTINPGTGGPSGAPGTGGPSGAPGTGGPSGAPGAGGPSAGNADGSAPGGGGDSGAPGAPSGSPSGSGSSSGAAGTGDSPDGGGPGDAGDGGGGGGGGGGGKMICTALNDHGYFAPGIWEVDEEFGRIVKALRPDIVHGYQRWAGPLARAMRRNRWLMRLTALVVRPWAHEMAFVMGARPKGSRLGRLLMRAGLPVCGWLGRSRRSR
jgi:hypothetical protein